MPPRSLLFLLAALGARATDSLVARSLPARGGIQPPIFYNLTIFHVNDIHARLDEFSSSGTDCTAPEKGCYGGYARIKHTVDELRAQTPHSILLNAGDEFQGTLFYTFYHGEKIAETINQLGFDALTIGNHEFDGGDDQLGAFLKNLTFPVVCANIQSTHPDLNATIVPYTIIRKHQLAIIGVTTPDIGDISSPGPGTTFSDPVAAVQATINRLKKREPSVKRIIALTHIGYDKDKLLAQQTRGLDAIIGGHSHTLLGNMTGAEGAYPSIETNLDGDDVFIVTSYRWGEYLGKIELSFGSDGKIAGYTGEPIHLTNTTAQDTALQAEIEEWRQPFDEFAKEVIGESNSVLTNAGCKAGECTLGDVMTDAIVDYRAGSVVGGIINGGGVRATIDVGPVTRGEVVTAFPFGNVVVEIDFTGDELWKIFEGIFSGVSEFNGRAVVAGVQVSKEFRLVYNPSGAVGSRLISFEISGQPIDLTKTYRIGTVDFLAKGGDNQMPAQPPAEIVTLDALDEVLTRYIQKKSPITQELEGRISTST